MNFEKLDKIRCKTKPWNSNPGDNFGMFYIPIKKSNIPLKVICAPMHYEWQHVSVSLPNRCPTWSEMALVKSLFWSEDETVVQFHPKKSEYVNNHPHCLHLWRKNGQEFELPPSILTGIK